MTLFAVAIFPSSSFDLRNDFLDPHQHNVVTLLPLKRNDNNSKLGFIIERPISFFFFPIHSSTYLIPPIFRKVKKCLRLFFSAIRYRFIVSAIQSIFLCGTKM
jgi:hypothetical protein